MLVWWAVGCGLISAGCIYLDPINRRPKIRPIQRVCDGAAPTTPCNLDELHHGEMVQLMAVFSDPDSDAANSGVDWRILACDGDSLHCDAHPLYMGTVRKPSFVVPFVLEDAGGPVLSVFIDLNVFDERGASSTVAEVPPVRQDSPVEAAPASPGVRSWR